MSAPETLTGPAGTAELLDLDAHPHEANAAVAAWFLTCPRQSPAWDHYALSVVHLRPAPGVPAATLQYPEATHEVILAALDPNRTPAPGEPTTWTWLRPLNFVEQVTLPDDEAARQLLHWLAVGVTQGLLWAEPPLSGQREPWHSVITAWVEVA